jgi:glyoxylase I family protein
MAIKPHHAGLTVADLASAKRWYAEAFGFESQLDFELPGGVRGAMLRSPAGARVELFEVPGSRQGLCDADPPSAMQTRGFGHIAFEADSLEDAYEAAVAAGGTGVWDPRPSPEAGLRMAFLHDPEGNLIELIGP